jgi:hypothetical protein
MDGMALGKTNNMMQFVTLAAVARRTSELREIERDDLADRIVAKLAKAWNKGQENKK